MMSRFVWLPVALLIAVLNMNALRPIALLTQDVKSCCLKCGKNFCPMKKNAEAAPNCHSGQHNETQAKMTRTCNHSNDQEFFHYEAILVSLSFELGYSLDSQFIAPVANADLITFNPPVPPPRVI